MKKSVLVIGELLVDIISEQQVNHISDAKSFTVIAGGSPANVCSNLKMLGVEAYMVSCIGEDSFGNFLLNEFSKRGLSTEFITRSKQHPTSIVVVGQSTATPDFIAYRMADTQINEVPSTLIDSASIVHTSAFALSHQPARSSILTAFDYAYRQQKVVSVDWNYAPGIWHEDGHDVFAELCSMHPLLKVSLDDVSRFLKRGITVPAALEFLSGLSCKVVCLTCGADGVWYKTDTSRWQSKPAIKVDEVKDVTGAGDAFWSGFLFGYLNTLSLDLCIDNGLQLAAEKIKRGTLYSNITENLPQRGMIQQ